jgi:hypothetical protein
MLPDKPNRTETEKEDVADLEPERIGQ